MVLKHILQWISKRSVVVVVVLLLGVGTLLAWFIVSGFSPNAVNLSLGIAAISAFFAAISSIATLLQAVEAQRQRESTERPYIIIYFDISSRGEINFLIQNIGNSPALNIGIDFDDPAPTDFAKRPLGDFERPISFLPPGKSVRQLMGYGQSLLKEESPTKFRATVRYASMYNELFKEEVEQDLAYLRQITFPKKSVEESLEEIAEEVGRLSEWSSG